MRELAGVESDKIDSLPCLQSITMQGVRLWDHTASGSPLFLLGDPHQPPVVLLMGFLEAAPLSENALPVFQELLFVARPEHTSTSLQ